MEQTSAYSNADVLKMIEKWGRLLTRRATWDSVWASLAALERPLRIDVRSRRAPGAQQTQSIFSGVAPKAASDLASALQGALSPVDMQWFRLVFRYKPLNDIQEVREWLEDTEQRMNMAFQQSNFEGEMHEQYQDLSVFGTGCVLTEEKPMVTAHFNGLRFRCIPPGRYSILEGPDGRVQEVWRSFEMTYEAADQVWGSGAVDGATLSTVAQDKVKQRPEEKLQLLHIMRPVPGGPRGHRAYESVYLEFEQKHLLNVSHHRRLRFSVPRWSKTSEEEYGRGQGHLAYPDVATLNRATEMRFKQWAKDLDPPVLTVDDGVIGKVRLQAGNRTIVRGKDMVWPFQTGTNWQVTQFNEERLIADIRNAFYADKLQLPNKPYMTAYEVAQHVEVMQRELGPTIGRVKSELLTDIIDNVFDLMFHAGAFLPPPPAVLEAAAQGLTALTVEYESPLIRSQRTADIVALDRTIQSVQPLIAANQEGLDNFDMDWLIRHTGTAAGLPARGFRTEEQVQAIRSNRQQQVAAAQQQQQQESQAKVAKDTGMAVKHVASVSQEQGAGGPALPAGGAR